MSQPRMGTLDFVAHTNPKGLALGDGKRSRSWDAWSQRASALGRYLRDTLGIEEGQRVAWMLPNGLAYYDLWFALQKIGATPVSVPYRLTGQEAAFIISDSGARALVCDAERASVLREVRDQLPAVADAAFIVDAEASLAQDLLPGAVSLEAAIERCAGASFFREAPPSGGAMVYTSGTTGKPKGALRDFRGRDRDAMRNYQMGMTMSLGFAPGQRDVHLLCCPLYHSAPPVFANLAQVMGGRVVVMERFDPEQALATIEREKVSSTFMVPTMLRRIVSLPEEVKQRYDLSSMRRLLTGAAPCPLDLKQKVMALFPGPCLHEFYGSTETAVVTVIQPDQHLAHPGSCGLPIRGCEIKVLDEDMKPVPTNDSGLLWVKNPMMTSGYHNNDSATEKNSHEGFFCVGDVARLDQDGFCYIVDRKNDMIISGGVNIYPAEVEAELRKHPAVYDCGVFGIPNEEWGEEVKAVVQTMPGQPLDAETLIDFVSKNLAGFKRPRSVDFLKELPYSPTGKLLKRQLRAPYWEDAQADI